ncbi:MAG: hypothetical protein ACR2HR_15010 [Euzebya sp.]
MTACSADRLAGLLASLQALARADSGLGPQREAVDGARITVRLPSG